MARPQKKTTGRVTPKGTQQKWTSPKEWTGAARHPVPIELPSGNTVLAVNKGMKVFVREGKIPNSLLPFVTAALKAAEQGKEPDMSALQEATPEMLVDVLNLTDEIAISCIVQPSVLPEKDPTTGEDWEERDEDELYVDQIDLDDKFFLFNWCTGGTKDVEKFREEQADVVADLQSSQGMAQTTE